MSGDESVFLMSLLGPSIAFFFSCAFLWAYLSSETRPAYLLLFAAGFFSIAPAVALQALGVQAGLMRELTTPISGVLFITCGVLVSEGLRNRYGAPSAPILDAIALGLAALGLVYFLIVSPNFQMRAYIVNLVPAVLFLWSLASVWRAMRKRRIDRLLSWIILVAALHLFPKTILLAGAVPSQTRSGFEASFFWSVSMLLSGSIIAMFCLTMLISVVTERVEALERERDVDRLTGVLNRRGFDSEVARIFAAPGVRPTLVLCDLDHFKQVNDTFGHAVGDNVLRACGALMRERRDALTLVGRIGGEEFAMLRTDGNGEAVMTGIETLRRALQDIQFGPPAGAQPVTASFGVARCEPGETYHSLFDRADRALYKAKLSGRDRIVVDETATRRAPAARPAARG